MTDIQPIDPIAPAVILASSRNSTPSREWLSERVALIVIVCLGYIGLLIVYTRHGEHIDASVVPVLATALGTLGTTMGAIVAAVFKTDKTDRQNADTLAKMATNVTPTAPVDSVTTTTVKTA